MNRTEPSWIEVNPSIENKDRIVGTVPLYLYVFVNKEYLMPEVCIVGEVKRRQVYEELDAEYHAWVSDYETLQKVWVGRFKTLQEAKDKVSCTVNELLKEE